jgi:hypothetical protein
MTKRAILRTERDPPVDAESAFDRVVKELDREMPS